MHMKKFTLLILGLFILTGNLHAEIICLKASKKVKVVNDKVNIKTPRLITVATSSCPAGYVLLTDLNKAPTTQTGVWNLSGGSSESYAASQISFPTKLQTVPTEVVFVEADTVNTTCTGTVTNPTAPEGVLCIYEDFARNLKSFFHLVISFIMRLMEAKRLVHLPLYTEALYMDTLKVQEIRSMHGELGL